MILQAEWRSTIYTEVHREVSAVLSKENPDSGHVRWPFHTSVNRNPAMKHLWAWWPSPHYDETCWVTAGFCLFLSSPKNNKQELNKLIAGPSCPTIEVIQPYASEAIMATNTNLRKNCSNRSNHQRKADPSWPVNLPPCKVPPWEIKP